MIDWASPLRFKRREGGLNDREIAGATLLPHSGCYAVEYWTHGRPDRIDIAIVRADGFHWMEDAVVIENVPINPVWSPKWLEQANG